MFMIMFVLDNNALLDQVLEAWSDLGLPGATIIESTGLHRRRIKRIPMRYAYGSQPLEEKGNTTLFIIVENEAVVRDCLRAVEAIVGDLDGPNTGVFSAWPIPITKGVPNSEGSSNGLG